MIRPCSSMDRVPASEAEDASSILAKGTTIMVRML